LTDLSPGGFDVAGLGLSHEVLELGEDLFDRVEVWAVGRQEDQVGAPGPDGGSRGLGFVAAEVVQDDDVARLQGGGEDPIDVEQEELPR
jgi:hypothetical protein